VLPALIRKLHLAKLAHAGDVESINRDEVVHGAIPADLKANLLASANLPLTTDHSPVVLWGTGTPRREFLYVDDLANALVFLATLDDARYAALVDPSHCPLINVGSGTDLTIRELAETVAEVVGFKGAFVQDSSKPDGTMRKIMDVSRIHSLGWAPVTDLRAGIKLAYGNFIEGYSA
jgi:GDP-L-fucose synthase